MILTGWLLIRQENVGIGTDEPGSVYKLNGGGSTKISSHLSIGGSLSIAGTIHGNLTGTASEATTVIGSTQSNITTLDNLTSIGYSTVSDANTNTSTTIVKGDLQIDKDTEIIGALTATSGSINGVT